MTFSDVAQSYRKPWFTLPAACYSHSRLSLSWSFLSRLLTALTGGALPLTAKLGIYTTNLLHARLASTTMLQKTQQHEDMRSAASSQSRVSTPVSWTVTRSPAQGTRRMILVYQIGVAHRVSLQGVELAKSGSQIRIFSGRPADMSVLANHTTAQVYAVCFSGVQARTLPTYDRTYVQTSRRLCMMFCRGV